MSSMLSPHVGRGYLSWLSMRGAAERSIQSKTHLCMTVGALPLRGAGHALSRSVALQIVIRSITINKSIFPT
jgi:hypothetical protein